MYLHLYLHIYLHLHIEYHYNNKHQAHLVAQNRNGKSDEPVIEM